MSPRRSSYAASICPSQLCFEEEHVHDYEYEQVDGDEEEVVCVVLWFKVSSATFLRRSSMCYGTCFYVLEGELISSILT